MNGLGRVLTSIQCFTTLVSNFGLLQLAIKTRDRKGLGMRLVLTEQMDTSFHSCWTQFLIR